MGPAVFILAIMGCGEGNSQCETVATLPAQYATVAACDANSEAALHRYADIEYPVVVAQCLKMDAAAAAVLKGSDVKLPAPEQAAPVKRPVYKAGQNARG